MVLLSKEDKEIWEEYKLNMHQLRINVKKLKTNSQNENVKQSFETQKNKNYIFNKTFEQFQKLLNKRKIEPDGIIDLHGFNLKEAKSRLKKYVFQSFNSNKRNILIITGKGLNKTGLLKREVPIWLNQKEIKIFLIGFENAPKSFGGEGALIIRLKNKQKVSI